jgi:hypothetical protein
MAFWYDRQNAAILNMAGNGCLARGAVGLEAGAWPARSAITSPTRRTSMLKPGVGIFPPSSMIRNTHQAGVARRRPATRPPPGRRPHMLLVGPMPWRVIVA